MTGRGMVCSPSPPPCESTWGLVRLKDGDVNGTGHPLSLGSHCLSSASDGSCGLLVTSWQQGQPLVVATPTSKWLLTDCLGSRLFFFKILFIHERQREREAEGEAGFLWGAPCRTQSQDPGT